MKIIYKLISIYFLLKASVYAHYFGELTYKKASTHNSSVLIITKNSVCTGALVSSFQVLTNAHCLKTNKGIVIAGHNTNEPKYSKFTVETFDQGESLDDFKTIELEIPLGEDFGFYDIIKDFKYKKGQKLHIEYVMKKNNKYETYEQVDCEVKHKTIMGHVYHDCDTQPGSSGAVFLQCNKDQNEDRKCEIIGINTGSRGKKMGHFDKYTKKNANILIPIR